MKVKIIKSESNTYWYSSNVGSIYEVDSVPDDDGDYSVISGPGYWDSESGEYKFNLRGHYIGADDCEIVNHKNKWGQSKLEFKFV